jgi:initiation factor 1A
MNKNNNLFNYLKMTKNVFGGSKHKSLARKNGVKENAKTRLSENEYELYAQVIKLLGNGMCHVLCQDDKTRLCIIRGKFRGKNKRDNILTNVKWILVGLREYES